MQHYADIHGRLPPAAVCGKDGQPLYSWRVAILPFLDQDELYEEFRRDEPWDSEHNLSLLARMPLNYRAPGRKASRIPSDHTFCHVFVGNGTAFEDRKGQRLKDFTGTSNTILIIEGGEPVPWTKPQELPYASDQPIPALDGPFSDIVRVAFADGSRRDLNRDTDDNLWRALITRNSGEKLPYSLYR
jgi:hypothetical protein